MAIELWVRTYPNRFLIVTSRIDKKKIDVTKLQDVVDSSSLDEEMRNETRFLIYSSRDESRKFRY